MAKKIFDFFRYILISALAVLLFASTYYSLSDSFPNDADKGDGVSFHNMPENSVDILVLGSSHSQYSFCPPYFYQDTGLYSYVLGSACQPLPISYKLLREALKTQHPKLVVLEVFTALPMKEMCDDISCYIIPAFAMTGEEKYQTLKDLPQESQDTYLNPFVATHNKWREDGTKLINIYNKSKEKITNLFNDQVPNINKVSGSFGYVDVYPELPVENYWYATNTYEDVGLDLNPTDEEALNDIWALCQENDIELLLYKTPIDSLDNDNLTYLHRVWEWAERNGIPYIDFVEKSPNIKFYMCIHSNSFHSYITGASVITGDLAKYIKQNYEFNHTINEDLESKYQFSERNYVLSSLNYEYDPAKYLPRLMNYHGPILIINSRNTRNTTINNFLNSYNISGQTICLYNNGEIIDSSETCIGINYYGHDIYADFSTIEIDGEKVDNISSLTLVVFSDDLCTWTIIETDTNKMWKKGFNWYGE